MKCRVKADGQRHVGLNALNGFNAIDHLRQMIRGKLREFLESGEQWFGD